MHCWTYFNNQLNAYILLLYNNMYVTLQSTTCFEHQHAHLQALQSALNQCTVHTFTESDDTRCRVNIICPPEDGHVDARNMSMIIM